MNELADDSPIYSRFNNPNEYLDNRKFNKLQTCIILNFMVKFLHLQKLRLFLIRISWLTWRRLNFLEVLFLMLKRKYGITIY